MHVAHHFLFIVLWSSLLMWATPALAQHTGADLTKRYYDTRRDCGGPDSPAFLCSGVLLRGTRYSPAYHSWDPSPLSQNDGGISFSFLRTDAKIANLAWDYTNGVIFYPVLGAPQDKVHPDYLCAYPMDAATDLRTQNGCGLRNDGYAYTEPCQQWRITSGAGWVEGYRNGAFKHSGAYACGFIVADHEKPLGGTANGFAAVLDAIKLLGADALQSENEIRAKVWPAGLGKTLPIQAFFYIADGLPNARNDQEDLFKSYQVWVPVIKMVLPQSLSEEATFHYLSGDQAIPPQ